MYVREGKLREKRKEKILFYIIYIYIYNFFFTCWTLEAMESSIVDVMLGGQTPQINGQDQIVNLGNYCCTSFRVASIDEVKIHQSKD